MKNHMKKILSSPYVLGMLLAFFIIAVAGTCFLCFHSFRTKTYLNDLLSQCSANVMADVEAYSATYQTVSEQGISAPFTTRDAKVVASTVTKSLTENFAAYYSNSDRKSLEKKLENAITEQMTVMGITMETNENDAFISGVQALVDANLYKTISDNEAVTATDLAALRAALKEELNIYEKQLTSQGAVLSVAVVTMDNLLTELSVSENDSKADSLQVLSDNMTALNRLLSNVEAGRYLTEDDRQALLLTMEVFRQELIMQGDLQPSLVSKNIIENLLTVMENMEKEMNAQNSISDEVLTSLRESLEKLENETAQAIAENALQISALASSLNNLSGNFEDSLSVYIIMQENFSHLMSLVRGGRENNDPDKRFTDICQAMEEIIHYGFHDQMAEDLSSVQATIGTLQSRLTKQTDKVTLLTNNMTDSAALLQTMIESKEDMTLSKLTNMLEALRNTKKKLEDSLEDSDQTLNQALNSAISHLQDAIENDITTVRSDFSGLVLQLENVQSSLSTQDAELSEDFNAAITELKNFITSTQELTEEDLASLAASLAKVQAGYAALEADQKKAMENLYASLVNSLSIVNASYEKLNNKEELSSSEIRKLRYSLDDAKKELSVYVDNGNSVLSSSLAGALSDISSLQNNMIEGQDLTADQISSLSSSLSIAQVEVEHSFAQADEILRLSLIDLLQELSDDMASDNELTKMELDKLTEALANAKKELSASTSEQDQELLNVINGALDSLQLLADKVSDNQTDTEEKLSFLQEDVFQALSDLENTLKAQDTSLDASLSQAIEKLESMVFIEGKAKDEAISALSSSLQNAKTALESSVAVLEDQLSLRLSNLSTSLTENIGDLDERSTEAISSLNDAKNLLSSQLNNLSSTMSVAENNISSLQGSLSTLSDRLDDKNTEQDAQIATKAGIDDLATAVASINQSIEEGSTITQEQIESLNSAVQSLETMDTEISAELMEQVATLTESIEKSSENASSSLDSAVTELETKDSELFDELNKTVTILNNSINSLQSNTSTDLTGLQEQVDELNQKLKEKVTYSSSDGINTITIH